MKMGHTIEDYCTRAASLMAKLNHQRMKAQFCDCVIRKGLGQVYPVHRCILAASSPVFASILDSTGVLVELEAPCLSDCILGYLLDYIYTGTLPHMDYKLYSYLLAAAQYLEMDELQLTIRTKAADTLEYCNTSDDEANSPALLTPRIDCFKNPSESPLHHCSDCVYMRSKPEVMNSEISETDQTSRITSSSGRKQQLSTVFQDKGKNQLSRAIKPETWHKNKQEEARSRPFVSAEEQENEPTQIERTQDLCKNSNVKDEKIESNSGEGKNHNSSHGSTSVICHSSRVTRVHEENVAIKLPHDIEPYIGQIVTERTYCAIAEDPKASNLQFINQDLECIPAHDYRTCSVNLFGNNNLDNFEKRSNKNEQYGISTKNTTCSSVQVNNVATGLVDVISDTRKKFHERRICAKRKQKEENSGICSKSAKIYAASAVTETSTDYFSNTEQDTTLENKNTTTKLYRSVSEPPEGNTCQSAYTQCSYSGHLFYHCESRNSHTPFAPEFSPLFSDSSSGDNNVSICSTLSDQTATLDEGQVVLLDISSKSSDTLVSYERTSETCVAGSQNEINRDHDKTQNSKGADNSHITYWHEEGGNILTNCTSACGKECAHNSTISMSVSHLIPSSSMQANASDLSSHLQQAFQCSLCDRSFSQRGSLNRHVRSHLGVRPFPCPQCPMSFSRQYRVVEHMRVHQRSAVGIDSPKPPASSV